MFMASVTTSPSNPSCSLRRKVIIGFESEAGVPGIGSKAGTSRCPIITERIPDLIALSNGSNSFDSSDLSLPVILGSSQCESIEVFPCPGKCFTARIILLFSEPFINSSTNFETYFSLSENERILITGLSELSLISATGAKFIFTPSLILSSLVALLIILANSNC